jgi:hypothetical protein
MHSATKEFVCLLYASYIKYFSFSENGINQMISVVEVLVFGIFGYISRGPVSIPGATRFSEK